MGRVFPRDALVAEPAISGRISQRPEQRRCLLRRMTGLGEVVLDPDRSGGMQGDLAQLAAFPLDAQANGRA